MCIISRMMMVYKVITCLTIIFSFAVSTEDADWSAEELNCINELKLNKTAIHALNKQFIAPEHDADFNDFVSCYWKRKGIQNENGEINFDKLDELLLMALLEEFGAGVDETAVLVAEIFENSLNECKSRCTLGKTHGQTAVRVQNCIAKEVQKRL